MLGRAGRPQRFRDEAFAPVRGGRCQRCDAFAGDTDPMQQRLHGELRMSDGWRIGLTDQLPRGRVEGGVEPGQHHGAMWELGDGCNQRCGRRHRAGRAGGDHGGVRARRQARSFRRDQRIAPGRSFDRPALGEDGGPYLARDLEECEGELPVAVERFRDQQVEPVPGNAAGGHIVDEARKPVRQRQR